MNRKEALVSCKHQGFTLVELVMVIILLAIMGTFSSQFISSNVIFFKETVDQTARLNDARFVLNRVSKELNSAIAFSTRIETVAGKGQCLRFIPYNAASQYLGYVSGERRVRLIMDPATRGNTGNISQFRGQRMSILNTERNDFLNSPEILTYTIDVTARDTHANVITDIDFAKDSAASRYFIFNQEVSYCLENGATNLYRYQDDFPAVTPTSNRTLMMSDLTTNSRISLTNSNEFSHAITEFDFGFQLRDGNAVRFDHQVVMSNVP